MTNEHDEAEDIAILTALSDGDRSECLASTLADVHTKLRMLRSGRLGLSSEALVTIQNLEQVKKKILGL